VPAAENVRLEAGAGRFPLARHRCETDDDGMTSLFEFAAAGAGFLSLALLAGWLVVRRMRRTVQGWRERVLGTRVQWMPPGPRREVAMLRHRLAQELQYTEAMLSAAPDGVIFRADAGEVLRELVEMAASLGSDLRAIEHFSDPRQQGAALAVVAPQVEQLIETSYSARQTIVRTSAEDRDRRLSRVRDYVAQQEKAAAAYRHGGRDLTV
jgi:hypothetical protein